MPKLQATLTSSNSTIFPLLVFMFYEKFTSVTTVEGLEADTLLVEISPAELSVRMVRSIAEGAMLSF